MDCFIPENSEVVLTKPTPPSLETPVGTSEEQSKVSESPDCTGTNCPIPENSAVTPTIPISSSPKASMKTSTLNDTQVWTIDLQSNLNSLLSSLNTLRTKFNINFGVTAQLGSIYNSLPTFLSIQRKIQQLFSLKISQDCKDYVLNYIVINKNGNWNFAPELKYFFDNIPNTNYIPAYPLQLLNDTLPENINCNKIIIIYKDLIDLIISQSKIIQSKQQQSKIEPSGSEVDLGSLAYGTADAISEASSGSSLPPSISRQSSYDDPLLNPNVTPLPDDIGINPESGQKRIDLTNLACGRADAISEASSGYSPSPSLQQLSPSSRSPQLQSHVTVSRVSPPPSRPVSPSKRQRSDLIGGAPPNPYTNIIKEIKNFQEKLKSLVGISISPIESKIIFQGLQLKEYEYSQGQKGQQSSGFSANDRKLLQDILDNYNNIKGIDADIKNSIQSIPGQVEQLVLKKLTMNELARQQLEDRIRKQIEDQDNKDKVSTLKQLQQENKNLEMVLEKYRQYGYIGINPADDDDLITFVNPNDDEKGPKEGTPKSLVMGMYNSKEEDPQKYNFYRH